MARLLLLVVVVLALALEMVVVEGERYVTLVVVDIVNIHYFFYAA
jgi:hypothetical protein